LSKLVSRRILFMPLGLLPPALLSLVMAPAPSLPPMSAGEVSLGFDFGTSGARCAAIAADGTLLCSPPPYSWGERERSQTAADWTAALETLLDSLDVEVRSRVARIAISGTSSTVTLVDARTGLASTSRGPPRMYSFNVVRECAEGERTLELIGAAAPAGSPARAASSSLAKLLAWHLEHPLEPHEVLCHQADYLAAQVFFLSLDPFLPYVRAHSSHISPFNSVSAL
jgi:sugar (pentulose or hexulose) kinase